MEPVRIFSTRPVSFKIYAGQPARSTGFLQKIFVHSSMHLMKNFQKGGRMGEVLKFMTPVGGLRNKRNKFFAFFAKITQFYDLFRLNFGLKDMFWAAQNLHKISIKKTGGHKLNYQTFLLMTLCVGQKKKLKFFNYWWQIICNLPSSKH